MAGNGKVTFNRQSYYAQSDTSTQIYDIASKLKEQMPDFKDEAAIELYLEVCCLLMHTEINVDTHSRPRCTAQRYHCTR